MTVDGIDRRRREKREDGEESGSAWVWRTSGGGGGQTYLARTKFSGANVDREKHMFRCSADHE